MAHLHPLAYFLASSNSDEKQELGTAEENSSAEAERDRDESACLETRDTTDQQEDASSKAKDR